VKSSGPTGRPFSIGGLLIGRLDKGDRDDGMLEYKGFISRGSSAFNNRNDHYRMRGSMTMLAMLDTRASAFQ